jgi:hypothetical protein
MPKTYEPIATQTLGSAAATVTFSSISGTYTDLMFVCAFSCDIANQDVRLKVGNGSIDTGTNYSFTYMNGSGTSPATGRLAAASYIANYSVLGTSTGQQNIIYQLQNYANTTTNKTTLARVNASDKEVAAVVGLWRSTSAINIISITNEGANPSAKFSIGSTFTLYGIKAA